MASQKYNIDLGVKGAEKAKQKLGGVDGAISKMGKAVGIASAAYFGAKGLINAFSTTIELAGIQEQAEKRLETALGRTSDALLKQASALQKVTTFGDEAIIGVQASIAAFTDNEEAIKLATEATLDLASATGMDLQAAGDLVAKSLGSSTNALSRYGIEVKGAVGSTERLETLTTNVGNLFGGQASAQAETMAGALEQSKNAAGDLAEAIGQRLSPFVKFIADDFKKVAENATEAFGSKQIDRQSKLNELLSTYSTHVKDLDEDVKKTGESSMLVSELFEKMFIGPPTGLTQEQADMSKKILEDELKLYHDLIFAKKENISLIESSTELDYLDSVNKVSVKNLEIQQAIGKQKSEQLQADLKSAALSGQSAMSAMKSVVRAETMEAVAGYISSVLKTVPFPANVILAAGGGALVAGMLDKALSAVPEPKGFATGGIVPGTGTGDIVPAMLTPGEVILNQAQQENLVGNMASSVTVNIQGNMVGNEEFVRDSLIPEIERTVRGGLA